MNYFLPEIKGELTSCNLWDIISERDIFFLFFSTDIADLDI